MKKFILFLLCNLIVFSFSATVCAEGAYFSGNIGAAILSDGDITDPAEPGDVVEFESDTGMAFGIALGYAFSNNIRTEIELAYQKNDLDKMTYLGISLDTSGDTSSLAGLLNVYYDFVNNSPFTPFITAGIGYAKVELNDFNIIGSGIPNINEDDSVFAYQLGAGVGYAISETLMLDVKYRFFDTADPEFDSSETEYSSHNFYIGLRVPF